MRTQHRFTLIAVLFLTAVVFAPFVADYFWLDDVAWITGAEQAPSLVQWTIIPSDTFPYRPLTAGAFALLGQACGCTPWPYRALGLGLHLVNVALAYALARRLTGDDRAALAGAALWAVYPVHRWAVLWIADLAGVAGGTFALVCLLAYARYRVDRAGRRWLILALACFALAVLAKETYLAVAFIVLLWYLSINRQFARRAANVILSRAQRSLRSEAKDLRHHIATVPQLPVGDPSPSPRKPRSAAAQDDTSGLPGAPQPLPSAEIAFLLLALLLALPIVYTYIIRPGESGLDLVSARYPANLARAMLFLLLPVIDPNAINRFGDSLRENLTVILLAAPTALVWLALLWRARSRRAWLLSLWAPVLLMPVLVTPFLLLPFKGRFLYLPALGFCLLLGLLWSRADDALRRSARGGLLRYAPAAALVLLVAGLGLFNMQQQWWVRNPERPAQLLYRYVWGGLLGCPFTPADIRAEVAREGVADLQGAVDAPLHEPEHRYYLTSVAVRALARELTGDTAGAQADALAARALALRGDFDARDQESFYLIPQARVLAYLDAQLARLNAKEP